MGNQNATGVHEEDKAANQSNGHLSNNESTPVEESKDDQLILPTAETETQELSAGSASELPNHDPQGGAGGHHVDDQALDIKEQDGNDEAQGIENGAADPKDDPRDQVIKDTTLNSTGTALHEPDDPVHSDSGVDVHVLDKINQVPSLHGRRESKATSISIDEVTIKSDEGEIEGLMDEKMLESEDQLKELIDTADKTSEQECKPRSKNHPEMCFIEEANKKGRSSKASHNEEFFHAVGLSDALIEHPNTKEEAEGTTGMNCIQCIDEKTGESDQIQVLEALMDTDFRRNKHDQESASSADLLDYKEVVEDSHDDQTEDFCNVTGESEAEKDSEIAHFKDLETVAAKPDISCNLMCEETAQSNPQEADSEDVTNKQNSQLDQAPLLYHKKLATMRSLLTPSNAQLLIPLDSSAEENTIKIVQERRRKSKDDQMILPTAETQELSAASELPNHDLQGGAGDHHVDDQALDIKEQDGSDDAQGIENEAADAKDDTIDQEIKDTILISNGAVLHEPDTVLYSDGIVDDHALEKFNQDPSLHVRRESKLTSFNIDEISVKDAGGEIEGLVAESMLEAAKDQPKEVIGTVDISSEQECKTSSKSNLEMSFTEEVIEGDISLNTSLPQEFIRSVSLSDASIENPNAKDEAEGTKVMNCKDEKNGESDQIQQQKAVMDTNFQVIKHDHESTSSADLLNCKEIVEDSHDDQIEDFCNVTGEPEAEADPKIADYKDLEIVDAKADISCNLLCEETVQSHPQEADSEDVTDKQHNTQSQMEKSPSFKFDLMNLDKIEELDQTPLLYHKKLATMRSLSAPGNTRLLIPFDRSAEEKTIKIVQERRRESDYESKSPLHGFLKPQENHEKVENDQNLETQKGSPKGHGMEIVPGKEKRNKAKISSSYFFSICICCTGVAQLNADP